MTCHAAAKKRLKCLIYFFPAHTAASFEEREGRQEGGREGGEEGRKGREEGEV